jgi:hypothetical protein
MFLTGVAVLVLILKGWSEPPGFERQSREAQADEQKQNRVHQQAGDARERAEVQRGCKTFCVRSVLRE